MSDLDYEELLGKVLDETSNKEVSEDRFQIPKADIFYEGNRTIIKNFDKICDTINRDPDTVLKYLLKSVGTAGEREDSRVVFQGKIPAGQIQSKLEDYIETHVICSECGRPDTHLVKKDRTTLIRCDACGAFRSVKARKGKVTHSKEDKLEEGKTIEVFIKDIGKKGDGVGYYKNYTVFVPGAVKGSKVKTRIKKISGSIAFGKLIES
ncbi:MAG: translation initiation factor IF-2 subunit beta [Candidatus Thermoplasmatota archaeon]